MTPFVVNFYWMSEAYWKTSRDSASVGELCHDEGMKSVCQCAMAYLSGPRVSVPLFDPEKNCPSLTSKSGNRNKFGNNAMSKQHSMAAVIDITFGTKNSLEVKLGWVLPSSHCGVDRPLAAAERQPGNCGTVVRMFQQKLLSTWLPKKKHKNRK